MRINIYAFNKTATSAAVEAEATALTWKKCEILFKNNKKEKNQATYFAYFYYWYALYAHISKPSSLISSSSSVAADQQKKNRSIVSTYIHIFRDKYQRMYDVFLWNKTTREYEM